jgi:2-polyprenyl-6-methoxyphenol hydroxylase-like FAD-dependent oxidoreductase
LASALALARAGVAVTLVERDLVSRQPSVEAAFSSRREGIAHFQAPHAFLPRGVKVLRERAPDLYGSLLAVGAREVRPAAHLAEQSPEDGELVYLGVRRPVIEWVLREAVLREPAIQVVAARVVGVVCDGSAGDSRVCGVRTDRGEIRGAVTVDAMGRTSRVRRWLADGGIDVEEESTEVGVLSYSRYYRLRPGRALPSDAGPLGPRGDLGFGSFLCFHGDNGTFAIAFVVPTWDGDLKLLRQPAAHEELCRALPQLRDWVDPERVDAVTGVIPMGALRTTWYGYERAQVKGLVAVADSFCHTDPSFALGLSLALVHGFALADVVREHGAADTSEAYWQAVTPELRERFELARDVSALRLRRLRGEQVPIDPEHAYPLYSLIAPLACAPHDPEVLRAAYRRQGFLDRLAVLDGDAKLQERVAELFPPIAEQLARAPRLSREEAVEAITRAVGVREPSRLYSS